VTPQREPLLLSGTPANSPIVKAQE